MGETTIGEHIAELRGEMSTVVASVGHIKQLLEERHQRLTDDHIELRRRVDQQGERFGTRLDDQAKDIKDVTGEVEAFRNKVLGAIAAVAVLSGGSVAAVIKLLGA